MPKSAPKKAIQPTAEDYAQQTAIHQEGTRIKIKYGEYRRLNSLYNWPENPNKMTQKEAVDLKKSLKKFGVTDVPIIDESGMILGGNHRAGAIFDIMGPEYIIPVTVISGLTREEATQLALALNKIHGSPDSKLLKTLIDTLQEPDELLNLGFDVEDFKDLEVSLDVFTGKTEADGFEVLEESKERKIKCPKCGHEFTKERKEGSKKIRNQQ